jgi:probable phosphoglycerate mutase
MTSGKPNARQRLELWLVRHGESLANTGGRLSGWSNVPLSELGERQARWLRAEIDGEEFDGVWASDLERAIATARLAFGEPTTDERLRELDFGALEGEVWLDIDEAEREQILEFEDYQAPGGESLAALNERVLDFVDSLPDGRHLIFSHGGTIRALTRAIGRDKFLKNGGLVAVDWVARKILRTVIPDLSSARNYQK